MSDSYEDFSDAVLELVAHIPPGRVMTYGAIAELLQQGGPRGVGGVMAREGPTVPWWRVVRANGTLPAHLVIEAQQHWLREGTPTRRGIVDIDRARWWPDDSAQSGSGAENCRHAADGRDPVTHRGVDEPGNE